MIGKRSFDVGEIEFVAAHPEDHTDDYLRAALKAAKDRKRRYRTANLDRAIARLEKATERKCA